MLPDHLHAIWTLPKRGVRFCATLAPYRTTFLRSLPRTEPISCSRLGNGERGIWQRGYWEYAPQGEDDLAGHADYIHFNPVRHGHASRVSDWPFPSFHRIVRQGCQPADWAGPLDDRKESGFEER